MKTYKMILFVLAIPALAAIAQQPAKPASPPASAREFQSAASAVKPIDAKLRDLMINEMKACWAALAEQNWDVFGGYLSENYMMADPNGLSDKTATMAMVNNGRLGKYALSDWHVAAVGAGGVAMTYKADQEWIAPDETSNRVNLFCTTTWEKQGDKWVIVMYSETPERKTEAEVKE